MTRFGLLLIICICFNIVGIHAQSDTFFLKINFLYGSKPLKKYKHTEAKYFGGIHGGHVTVEIDSVDYGFVPSGGSFHIFSHKKKRHSVFDSKKTHGKPAYMSGCKFATVYIPITPAQREKAKEILNSYCSNTPYDYAFFGMRCASATRDVLGETGILKKKNNFRYVAGAFYPKKFRKKIFRLAKVNQYTVVKQEGRKTRKWEKD